MAVRWARRDSHRPRFGGFEKARWGKGRFPFWPLMVAGIASLGLGDRSALHAAASDQASSLPPATTTSIPADETTPTSPPRAADLRMFGLDVDGHLYKRGLEAYLKENGAPTTDTGAQWAYHNLVVDRLLVERYARDNLLDRDTGFRRRLADVRRRLLFEFVIEQEVVSRIAITTESLLAYYRNHQSDFSEHETVQVRHILTDAREKAEAVRTRLLAGEDFGDLAGELSIHPSARQGGRLPPFSKGTYQPAFEKAAFGLKVGEISPVVQTDLGFHVIEKTSEIPARVKPFKEVAPQIRALLYERERKERVAAFLEGLRRKARANGKDMEKGS